MQLRVFECAREKLLLHTNIRGETNMKYVFQLHESFSYQVCDEEKSFSFNIRHNVLQGGR